MCARAWSVCTPLLEFGSRLQWRAILGCLSVVLASHATRARPEAVVESTVTIHEAYHFGWFPSVHQLSTGELICDFSLDGDVHDLENRWWGFVVSRDGGKSWGLRRTAGGVWRENSYGSPTSDGRLRVVSGYLTASADGSYLVLEGPSVTLGEGGRELIVREDVRVHLPRPAGTLPIAAAVGDVRSRPAGPSRAMVAAAMVFSGGLIADLEGGWLSPMYGRLEGDNHFRTIIVRADREAKRWTYVGTVAGDSEAEEFRLRENESKTEGFTEPCMVRLTDGRLLIVMRRGSDNVMYKSWSADEGVTWSKPSSLGFKGVEPVMIQMKRGLLAISTGRPGPIGIHLSADAGRTWSERLVVANFPGSPQTAKAPYRQRSTCYTGMIEVEPDRLLVVYDYLPNVEGWGINPPEQPNAVNTIFGTFVKVTKPN